VVTKFNFNSLFSRARLQSVIIPANVIAWGVYSFNSAAIKVVPLQSGNSSTAKEGEPSCNNGEVPPVTETSSAHTDLPIVTNAEPSGFSAEQQQLYKKRFNEGYNLLIDSDYVRWLGLYHSEFCPSESESVVSLFSDIYPEEHVAVLITLLLLLTVILWLSH